jgi:hypothetical protein
MLVLQVPYIMTMKNAVFWGVTPCGSCKNRRLRGPYRLHHQGDKNRWARNVSSNEQPKHAAKKYLSHNISLQRAQVVPSSPILVTLMIEPVCFSETSVFTWATWHNIPEDGILLSYRCENLKSYIMTMIATRVYGPDIKKSKVITDHNCVMGWGSQ